MGTGLLEVLEILEILKIQQKMENFGFCVIYVWEYWVPVIPLLTQKQISLHSRHSFLLNIKY